MTAQAGKLDADLVASLHLEKLLAGPLSRHIAVVADSIAYFLERLPSNQRQTLYQRMAGLPNFAPPELRALELLRACPVLHKLGQVLARDRRLPHCIRKQLERLESMPSWTPLEEIQALLKQELGDALTDEHVEIEPSPLAEASVAVVLPFVWKKRDGSPPVEGVFKILKPNIDRLIDEELIVWSALGEFLDAECDRYDLPQIGYEDTWDEVANLLRAEIRLDLEQCHLQRALALSANSCGVNVPAVLPFCTPRITAMTRLHGRCVSDVAELSAAARRTLAGRILRAFVLTPILSTEEKASFHADPHAGNLLAGDDGTLGILDWSLVGNLTRSHREQIAQIGLGALTNDVRRIARAIEALSRTRPDEIQLRALVDAALEEFTRGRASLIAWLTKLFDTAVTHGAARFDADLLLFRKVLFTLDGVLADVDPDFRPDELILGELMLQFVREWPERWSAPPGTRGFSTHLSNADLMLAGLQWPFNALQSWSNLMQRFTAGP